RANIRINSPLDYGPIFGGISVGLLTYWRAGSWVTSDPIDILSESVLEDPFRRKDRWEFDLRAEKRLSFGGGFSANLFVDVENVFDIKYLDTDGFRDGADQDDYWYSLKLPLYKLQEYQDAGLEAGDDKFGDIKSEDKPYIDMPNRDHLTFQNPRAIVIGMTFNF
ncbi:hypothetical protein ACFL4K_01705, partial [Candidatus Neomarinimicrobiota bacterium]